jgi:alpha-galactosidase
VWYSQVQGSKDLYVALFNIGDANKSVAVDMAAIGIKGKVKVRDLWKKQDVGQFKKAYQQNINLHGAALLRISPIK